MKIIITASLILLMALFFLVGCGIRGFTSIEPPNDQQQNQEKDSEENGSYTIKVGESINVEIREEKYKVLLEQIDRIPPDNYGAKLSVNGEKSRILFVGDEGYLGGLKIKVLKIGYDTNNNYAKLLIR